MTVRTPRPGLSASFFKGHGLGNDYLVFEEGVDWIATEENVRRVCDRHRGVGADGLVARLTSAGEGRVALRMFNPDGGEFERSGNGLRVLAVYLARREASIRMVATEVGGDRVDMALHGRHGSVYDVSVEMGRAAVGRGAIGMDAGTLTGDRWIDGPRGSSLEVVPVRVGNPHVVVLCDAEEDFNERRLSRLGPFLSRHPSIEAGANVQLVRPDGPTRCRALIWERGVGPTSASGTSACAVAVALVSTGRAPAGSMDVSMPGGSLSVSVSPELDVRLRGPVEEVLDGRLSDRLVATFERGP